MVKVIPNGGWGWMVVFGAALANMLNQSLVSLFGLIFGDVLERMGHGTSGVALVMNINSMVTNFSGLLTGWALRRFSARQVTIVGVSCTTVGMITASFATNIAEIIVTYSVLTGLGLGLIMPATFMAINSYFTDMRSHAVGISMAGTGIGQMVMPQVVRYLLSSYGYRGTTLILGAMSLNGIAGALLFQPVKWNMRTVLIEEQATEKTALLAANKVAQYMEPKTPQLLTTSTANRQNSVESASSSLSRSMRDSIAHTLGVRMLGDFMFVHIIVGLALVYTCGIAFTMLFPFYLQAERGLDLGETAMCMSVLSGMDIIARLTVPIIARRLRMSSRVTFLVGALLIAQMRSILVSQNDYLNILVVSGFCGYIRAATVINQNLTISEYTEGNNLPAALGLNMVAKGLFVLSVGQFFESASSSLSRSMRDSIAHTLGVRMLGDFMFVHIIVGLALVYTCGIAFTMLFPFYLQAERGLDLGETAMCMSVLSGMDIIARLTVPIIARRLRMSSRVTFLVGALLIAQMRSRWVRDYTDSYGLCIYIQNAVILLVVLSWSIEMVVRNCRSKI